MRERGRGRAGSAARENKTEAKAATEIDREAQTKAQTESERESKIEHEIFRARERASAEALGNNAVPGQSGHLSRRAPGGFHLACPQTGAVASRPLSLGVFGLRLSRFKALDQSKRRASKNRKMHRCNRNTRNLFQCSAAWPPVWPVRENTVVWGDPDARPRDNRARIRVLYHRIMRLGRQECMATCFRAGAGPLVTFGGRCPDILCRLA